MSKRVRAWKKKYKKSMEVSNFLTSKNTQLYGEILDLTKNLDEIVETVLKLNRLSIVKRNPRNIHIDSVPVGIAYVELTDDDNCELEQINFRELDISSKYHALYELRMFIERRHIGGTIGCHVVFQDKFKSSYFLDHEGLKNISPEVVANILLIKTTDIVKNIQKLL